MIIEDTVLDYRDMQGQWVGVLEGTNANEKDAMFKKESRQEQYSTDQVCKYSMIDSVREMTHNEKCNRNGNIMYLDDVTIKPQIESFGKYGKYSTSSWL